MLYTVHTDGWSRGNPGPSGCAFVVSQGSKVVETGKFFLGTTTNNQAEYMGAILGLTAVQKLWGKEVHLVMDSELVIKQLQWIYKVKDAGLKILNQKAKSILAGFKKTTFTSVLREKNKHADELANEAMDAQFPLHKMDESLQVSLW
jgi:ribonuclease H / adenosylcobalamin/alpha-ribazole phosphatase